MNSRFNLLKRPWLLTTLNLFSLACHDAPKFVDAVLYNYRDEGFTHDDDSKNTSVSSESDMVKKPHQPNNGNNNQCGVYFAPSTIPGAGNGLFAGTDFVEGDMVTPDDVIVPITDFAFHTNRNILRQLFLWNQYTWSRSSFEGAAEEANVVKSASFGIGAAINCNFALNNMEYKENKVARGITTNPTHAQMGSHPGAGASTILHGLPGYATAKIPAGMELFLDYGEGYFEAEIYDGVPRAKHFQKGQEMVKRFAAFRRSAAIRMQEKSIRASNRSTDAVRQKPGRAALPDPVWMGDLYDLTVHTFQQIWGSTVLKTLPDELKSVSEIVDVGVQHSHVKKSIRSTDWLKQHGSCADNLQEGVSTIPFAERGAFTRRRIAKGETVAPVPLIHVHPKKILNMYKPLYKGDYVHTPKSRVDHRNVTEQPYHQQLLLNYCFGHEESNLLLCPYGIGTALINHSRERANVKIIWSDKHTLHPEWYSLKPSQWANRHYSGLAWEYVATRDLLEGEEVLLDYGEDWERAWSQHVANWSPPTSVNCTPISAFDLNEQHADLKIPTAAEGLASFSLLNDNLCDSTAIPSEHFPTMECHLYYLDSWWDDDVEDYQYDHEKRLHPCRAVGRFQNKNRQSLYIVQVLEYHDSNGDDDDDGEEHEEEVAAGSCWEVEVGLLFGVSGDIFHFTDRPYTRDSAQPWSFRHEMGIPNEILPPAWRDKTTITAPTTTTPTASISSDKNAVSNATVHYSASRATSCDAAGDDMVDDLCIAAFEKRNSLSSSSPSSSSRGRVLGVSIE
ncbi:hypothetical protein ACA910_005483 [Epithemia clementina (nom. ined.)]